MTETMMTAPVPAHLVAVTSDGYAFVAECGGCGWASEWYATAEEADAAGVEHRDEAVGPPELFDVTMGELLDLQDDLADVVVWLAENWSADLPTPVVCSHTQYRDNGEAVAGVRLLAYCDSADVLVRVAELLGEPVVADAEPNRYGTRYQRALRRFGRVELDAYRETDPADEATP